jgi:hypothetical protein
MRWSAPRQLALVLVGAFLLTIFLAGTSVGAETRLLPRTSRDSRIPRSATPPLQAIVPPPVSQRVKYLGQTGGLIADFAVRDDLIFAPEGSALTVLRLGDEGGATVLSRVSPNQGPIRGVAFSEGIAFLITPIGLASIDVHEPDDPEVLSFLPGGGEAVQVVRGFAFVAARAAGLRIVNVSDPHQPVLASTLPLPGKALAIELEMGTDLAYVATDEGGLRVIDVGVPDLPREVASLELPAGVQQLKLDGEMLFLSSGDRIIMVDVREPGTLVRLGEYAPPRQARRVRIGGDYAYVADLDGGLKVFEVADMARPLLVYAETEGTAYDVLVRGNRAYVADGRDGVRIMNVANPSRPRPIAQVPLSGVAQGLDLWEDSLLVAAGEAGLFVVRIADERAPVVLGQLDTDGDARDVKAGESVAYVADGPAGLAVVSLVDRSSPALRGTLYTAGEAHALGVDGTFVYLAADDGGMQIVNAIRPAAPFLVGALTIPDGQRAVDIALVNKRAYLAIYGETEEDTGLAIADVGFRDRPTILSRVQGPGDGVAVRGVEPIMVGSTNLMTVDARASSGPVLLGRYQPSVGAGGMDWSEGILYLTSRAAGPELTLLDVSDPAHPRERLHLGMTTEGGKVVVVDGRIYLAAGRRGLRSLDLADQTSVREHAIYDPMDTLTQLVALPDEAGVLYGAGEESWAITDVENPTLPQPLFRVQTDVPVHGLARAGDRLYAASTTRGLLIYDAPLDGARAAQPSFVGQWSGGTSLRDVLVHGGYLYLVDRQVGLMVLDPNPPERPTLIQTLPLPARSEQIVPLGDNRAYIRTAGQAPGLRLIDLGHPTLGVIPRGQFPADIVAVQVPCPVGDPGCSDPYAYTLDGGSLAVWDVESDLTEPLASIRINGTILLLAGERVFVGSDVGHVSIVDLGDPAQPRVVGMMGNNAPVRDILLHDNLLITGLETVRATDASPNPVPAGQLRVWNIEDPQQPEQVDLIDTPSPFAVMAQGVVADGRRQLVTAGQELTLFDLKIYSVPQSDGTRATAVTLTLMADLPLPSPAVSLHLDGDWAFVGTESGLVVAQGMGAGTPSILSEVPFDNDVQSVVVDGERAYIAVDDVGGLVLDLSDPSNPRQIARLSSPTGNPPRRLVQVGHQLWAIWDGWVGWLDIGTPQPGPSEIGTWMPAGVVPADLAVEGDVAYLTDLEAGLLVLDISDPAEPIVTGSLDTPGHAHAIAVADGGELGYVADGECGVRVVAMDSSAPGIVGEIGFWQTGYALDIAALGDSIYVADIGELMALKLDLSGEAAYPPVPQSPQPADGAMFYRGETALSWGPPATGCDPLTYDLYLGRENPPPLVASGLVSATFHVEQLDRPHTYYWQVVAHDRQGDETAGPLWQFQVRTDAQPPPTPTPRPRPELPPPEQQDVLPLLGGLVGAGIAFGAWWWIREKLRL